MNLRDVATGVTPLAHISNLDDSVQVQAQGKRVTPKSIKAAEEAAVNFSTRILDTAKFLTKRGADPRIPNEEGNDCITLVIYNALPGHVPILQHFLQLVSAQELQTHVNMFGNTAMVSHSHSSSHKHELASQPQRATGTGSSLCCA